MLEHEPESPNHSQSPGPGKFNILWRALTVCLSINTDKLLPVLVHECLSRILMTNRYLYPMKISLISRPNIILIANVQPSFKHLMPSMCTIHPSLLLTPLLGIHFDAKGTLSLPKLCSKLHSTRGKSSLFSTLLLRLDRVGTGIDSIDREIALRVIL